MAHATAVTLSITNGLIYIIASHISVVLFTGLWSIDEPQWIEHLQEFRNWKHAMDL
jgi:hypothetical protein